MAQPAAGNQTKVDAATRKTPVASRSLRRKRERSRALAISIGVLAIIAGLAAVSSPLISIITSPSPTTTAGAESERTGKIVVQRDLNRCKQMNFDNDSGRVTDDPSMCDDQVVLDSHGVPVPRGTIHRLDAISKSFFAK